MSKWKIKHEMFDDTSKTGKRKKVYSDDALQNLENSGSWFKSLGQDGWIKRFKETHGDRYDYSKVKFVRSNLPVIIICKEHGEFTKDPSSHYRGRGCPVCFNLVRRKNFGSKYGREVNIDLKELKELKSTGMSNVKLAKHFNCSDVSIGKYLRKIRE